jgi:hypothetical protein
LEEDISWPSGVCRGLVVTLGMRDRYKAGPARGEVNDSAVSVMQKMIMLEQTLRADQLQRVNLALVSADKLTSFSLGDIRGNCSEGGNCNVRRRNKSLYLH